MLFSAQKLRFSLLVLPVAVVTALTLPVQGQTTATGTATSAHAKAAASYAAIPLSFEANQGQVDSQVKFLSRGDGYSLFLTGSEAVFELRSNAGEKAAPSVLRMELAGASRGVQVSGSERLPGVNNYYIGNDPSKWRSGISTYGKVNYRGIYPGVDAVFYGNQRQLEYDFVVAAGADPRQISLELGGVKPRLDADGNVVLRLRDGEVALRKPVAYQNIGGSRKIVDAGYTLAGNRVQFRLGRYEHKQALVIDPVFTYLTYLGGSNAEEIGSRQVVGQAVSPAQGLALDSAGNVYVTGYTLSTDFPLANAFQPTKNTIGGNWSAFVSALNPTGTALIYSTYLGGSNYNGGASIAADSSGDVYVVGTTTSGDFPVTPGAFQTTLPYVSNAFVAKFNPVGVLTKATFLGGNASTSGFGVATDAQGLAYVVGYTSYNCTSSPAACFPTTPGALIPAPANSGNGTGYLSVFDANLSTLLYSTILGDPTGAQGTISETYGVTVDPTGNVYAVGITGSPNLPTTPGAFQTTLGAVNTQPQAGFVAKFGPVSSGASLIYLTYLEATGVSFGDLPGGVAADGQGNAYVGGYTNSPTFPTTLGAYSSTCAGNSCAFVTKLNPTGTGLVWSTFVEIADYFGTLQLDTQGNVYVVGHNTGFFSAVNPIQPNQPSGGFVAKLDPTGSTLLFSTLVGGTDNGGSLNLTGVAVDASGNIYVAGNLNDATLPTTPGVVQPTFAGGSGALGDGIIGKIGFTNSTTGLVVSPGSANVGQSVTFTATVSGGTGSATPTGTVTFYNGTAVLGSATLNASGVGTFSTSSLPAAVYSVIARYSSDGTYGISASAAQTLTISAPTVAVPDVVGLTQTAATSAITAANLVVGTVTTTSSSTVASGSVISESPVAGTQVSTGSAVNLVVSSGPAQVAVPNVVGSTQAAATTAILAAGLVLGTVNMASSSTVPSGSVISESPVAGTQVSTGSAVNLLVSSGPAIAVPNVVGSTQLAATSAITAATLVVGSVTTASSSTVPSGSVISESPVAGALVSTGSAVNLVVSSGPVQVAVPNVVGSTQAAATSTIAAATLVVGTVTTASSSTVPSGSVISESPVAGTQVNTGSAVNLLVSSGPAIAVPNVVGLTQTAATSAITAANLVVGSVTTASSSTVPSGSVISESPVAGTLVNTGSPVNLVVSSGPAQVAVPNVVGSTQAAATSAITAATLVVGSVTTASSSTVPSGSVISESPVAGTLVSTGSAVNLVVSSGPAKVAVPNVVGSTQAAATSAITAATLVVGTVTTASSSTVPSGSVISESPAGGTLVVPGSAVSLVISSGAPPPPPTAIIRVSSSNPQYAAVATPGGTAGPITLRGTISAAGGGNIGNAVVAVTLVPVVGSTRINCPVTNTGGALVATCATLPVNTYDVQWTIVGGGFSGPQVDSSLSVYDPALGSISGSCVAINNGVPFTLAMSAGYPNGRLMASLSFTENISTGNFVLAGTTPLAFSLVPGPGAGQETGILTTLATLNGAPNYTVQATLVENAAGQAIQCGLQVRDPNGASVTALSFPPVPVQLGMSVLPVITSGFGKTVTLTATVFDPSSISGSIQFQVNGVNVGTPVTVSGSGIYTTKFVTGRGVGAKLGVDNTITAILTRTSSTVGVVVASNVLTDTDAVGLGLIGPYAFGDPGQTITITALFVAYRGYIQYQVDGVNVGAPVQVAAGRFGLWAPLTYTIPGNATGARSLTAILLSVNGVPLQTSHGSLFIGFGG